jgi:hypothetical protein
MGLPVRINATGGATISPTPVKCRGKDTATMNAQRKMMIAAALVLAGCGGGAASGPGPASPADDEGGGVPGARVSKVGSGSVSAVLGPAGGSLELSGGPRVEIPAGSLQGAEEFVLREAPKTTAFFNSEHERPIGPTFILSPDVQAQEGRMIRVSLPLAGFPEGWGDPSIAYEYVVGQMVGAEDAEHTKWDYEDAQLTGGRLVADLPGLPGERLQFVLTNLESQ